MLAAVQGRREELLFTTRVHRTHAAEPRVGPTRFLFVIRLIKDPSTEFLINVIAMLQGIVFYARSNRLRD